MSARYSATEGGHVAREVRNPYEATYWAANQRPRNAGVKSTLTMLAIHADELASCNPSQELLAEETDQSISTVYRQLKQLEMWGLVIIEPRYVYEDGKKRRTSNRYFLQIDCQFDAKLHGRDYDAAVSGPPHLPVRLTGRSDGAGDVHLPVNLTGRSDQGEPESTPEMSCSPTGHDDATYRSAVPDEQELKSFRTKNSSSTPKGVEEEPGARSASAHTRVHTHVREGETTQPALNLETDISAQASVQSPHITDLENSPARTEPTEKQLRAKAANSLGQEWFDFCQEAGDPFPASEPGTKFTKFAEFTTMLARAMITSTRTEIWDALVLLFGAPRYVKFPSRAELEREISKGRQLRAAPSPTRQASAEVAVQDAAVGSELERRATAEALETTDAAMAWWTEEKGEFVPESQKPQLRAILLEAFSNGVGRAEAAAALTATRKSAPRDWEFANALRKIRSEREVGDGTARGLLAVINGGSGPKLSTTTERVLQGMAAAEYYRDIEEEEAEAAARRSGGVA